MPCIVHHGWASWALVPLSVQYTKFPAARRWPIVYTSRLRQSGALERRVLMDMVLVGDSVCL